MINFELISTVAFFALVAVFLIRDRKNIEFSYGIIIRRWDRGLQLIDGFVNKRRNFLRKLGTVAVYISVATAIFGLGFLLWFSFTAQRGIGLALPSVGGYQYPGPVISIPFWYWLIGIFLIIVTHESMHAVYARLENVKVKNYGILLLLVLPIGAFVDPDNKGLKRLSFMKKLRVLVAGSFINIVTGLITVLLFFGLVNLANYAFSLDGVKFESTIPSTPANAVGLSGIIKEINGQEVKSTLDLTDVLGKIKPGDELQIKTTDGTFNVKTVPNPDPELQGRAYIGISKATSVFKYKMFLSGTVHESVLSSYTSLLEFLRVIVLLSTGIGIANMLPMKPFDGGLVFEEIFSRFFGKRGKFLINTTTVITVGLLLFNLFGIPLLKTFI